MKTNNGPSVEQVLFLIRRFVAELTTEFDKTKFNVEKIGYGGNVTGLEIDPFPGDYSKILGKDTDHLRALKMICKLASDRMEGRSVELSVRRLEGMVEPTRMPDFTLKEVWARDHIRALTEDLFNAIVEPPFKVLIQDGGQGKTVIDVIVSSRVPKPTVEWMKQKLQPLYKSIGLKNGRIFVLNIVQDDQALRAMRSETDPVDEQAMKVAEAKWRKSFC
jgi:hypothetical protein